MKDKFTIQTDISKAETLPGGGAEGGIRDGDVVFLEGEQRGGPRELVVEE